LLSPKLQFREGDHIRLAALCRELDQREIRWVVSNSDTPFTREIFQGFQATSINARREINLSAKDRNIGELLFTNYEIPSTLHRSNPQSELALG
jgi:DNA adenine methylase